MPGIADSLSGVAVGSSTMFTRGTHSSQGAVHHTDTAAAAEWRALYGASADMMNSTAHTFRAGGAGVSYMTPIFHLTADDATILSMEHNNHCRLLGIATSKNQIFVTWTQLMPVIENMGMLRAPDDDLFGGEHATPVDERLLEWDPATMSILIDELPYTCTELSWAPWQQGIYLAGLCPGNGIRLYRYSHGNWALDDCIRSRESVSCSISKNFTVACACRGGRVELWVKGTTAFGTAVAPGPSPSLSVGDSTATNGGDGVSGTSWVLCRVLTLPFTEDDDSGSRTHDGDRSGGAGSSSAAATRHRQRDTLGVAWDESGALLAAGDQGGSVYVVAATQDSTWFGEVVYHQLPFALCGPCKQVAWSPSSGRSFLCLAMVFTTCVRLVLFRRPRFMNAAGLPHAAHSVGGGGGGRMGLAHGSVAPIAASPLEVLAMAQVPCEEVAKLSWNNTGTRFVTAHLDSSVNIWAVDFRYQHPVKGDEANATGSREEANTLHSVDSARMIGQVERSVFAAAGEKRLGIAVSVRRTSAVHPYHAVSK
ncbi:conserved hypothetical protein [Leishmania mexicana MHOM/GT/2001/U1103]|uniref:Uncharacterized protein n=1 Tax=Leishmania mexicana (strain MHOM/GT/2001/U1103) TaxID=929439 RepID=E9B539_LEIMU|nr:conserved hypothetical protein [Leishmania mexicana MHOM/GT/2001/U1103]CBZ30358.1 conserved hypothetical protein [Leishmania mexicana MHOM/GT/2001/U1103]